MPKTRRTSAGTFKCLLPLRYRITLCISASTHSSSGSVVHSSWRLKSQLVSSLHLVFHGPAGLILETTAKEESNPVHCHEVFCLYCVPIERPSVMNRYRFIENHFNQMSSGVRNPQTPSIMFGKIDATRYPKAFV